ncbi:threonine aldolase family protein [Paraburkholderia aspalathi]|uniref:L-threonine aldolase n=1 Tax=Paraburkholderia aspalathi TaxID=1324617 RepID=A0A1I7ELV3_9BURK|nr:GntG family PLP-dependent aldolase [Paraburkholderia aspalathi]SFU24910.1 L-threonine aldolase [Paraburkholderia aspalathi]
MSVVDLRSDLLSRPTPEMVEAMVSAALHPCSYNARDDKHVRELEALAASMLGMEDALFFPTCTMANQASLLVHCRSGDHIISDAQTHIAEHEAASTSGLSSVAVHRLIGKHGHLSPRQVTVALADCDQEGYRVSAVILENTHNRAGGTVMPREWQQGIHDVCSEQGIAVHLDGARLWNAASYWGCEPQVLVQGANSVAVSLNKTLGAPLGAILCGDRNFIKRATHVRQMLGGNWRPAGVVAAPAVVALKTMLDRVPDTNEQARRMGEMLARENPWLVIDLDLLHTNIVTVRLKTVKIELRELMRGLSQRGILATCYGNRYLRLVTYPGIAKGDVDRVLSAFSEIGQSVDATATL